MEMAIALDPLFDQVMVVGEGRAFLGALIVVSAELWPDFARERGLDPDAPESLASGELVADALRRVRSALAGFPGYAKIRRVVLLREPWGIDNGLLTPTLKVKRRRVLERYAAEVAAMYTERPAP
jgi:long-chain acyl-CoA synthetase